MNSELERRIIDILSEEGLITKAELEEAKLN